MITLGQYRAKSLLDRLHGGGRVPHSLLFLGQTGWGTLSLALDFARLLLCENPEISPDVQTSPPGVGTELHPESPDSNFKLHPEASGSNSQLQTSNFKLQTSNSKLQTPNFKLPTSACGRCNACIKTGHLTHPDLHFSYPTVGANAVSTDFIKEWRAALTENPYLDANTWLQRLGAENKQGNITKDECNAIIKKLSLKAFEGRYKILLMWLPEYLGKEGNRLLKLIEEPPEQTIFLLVAENADLILPTILSRCQLVKTDPLSDDDITAGLQTQRSLDAGRARQIAFLAGGDFQQALQLADNPENDDAALFLDWLRKCWRGNGVELVKWTDNFAKLGRENQKQFLHYGLHFLREMLAIVVTKKPDARLRPDELQTAQNMANVLDFGKITRMVQILNDNIYYIERNANPKILFLDTSIQLNRILKPA